MVQLYNICLGNPATARNLGTNLFFFCTILCLTGCITDRYFFWYPPKVFMRYLVKDLPKFKYINSFICANFRPNGVKLIMECFEDSSQNDFVRCPISTGKKFSRSISGRLKQWFWWSFYDLRKTKFSLNFVQQLYCLQCF